MCVALTVKFCRTPVFSKTDRHHFAQSAFHLAPYAGMGFDTATDQNTIAR